MVKLIGPCYSLTAQGWLGRDFYHRTGVVKNPYPIGIWPRHLMSAFYYSPIGWHYRRRRTWHGILWEATMPYVPSQPNTPAQQAARKKLRDGVAAWQALTDDEKDYYNGLSYPPKMSGYNRFLHYYILDKPA